MIIRAFTICLTAENKLENYILFSLPRVKIQHYIVLHTSFLCHLYSYSYTLPTSLSLSEPRIRAKATVKMEASATNFTSFYAKINSKKGLSSSTTLLGRSDMCLQHLKSNVHLHPSVSLRHKAFQLVASYRTQVPYYHNDNQTLFNSLL